MKKKSLEFLFDYLKAFSPTGKEQEGQEIWLDYVTKYTDDYFTDNYGTAVGVINPSSPYKVVIEAHADEISWYVNYIDPSGYIYVIRNGGSDHMIAPSKTVTIHTDGGRVKGVFGWPAIHVRRNEKESSPTMKNIFVDVGCTTKKEVEELGIQVGDIITFEDEPFILNKKYLTGRALDNRIGGFIIAEVAKKLKKEEIELPFGLYIVNAVQEEVGLRGAEMIASRINPDVAICTDVCHDTTSPMYDKKTQGDTAIGKGPVITFSPAVHNNVQKMLISGAKNKSIDLQRNASSRSTGTDTDAFAYSNDGVPSALLSIPLKYMHTTVETLALSDVEQTIDVIYEFLINLKAGHDFRYIK